MGEWIQRHRHQVQLNDAVQIVGRCSMCMAGYYGTSAGEAHVSDQ